MEANELYQLFHPGRTCCKGTARFANGHAFTPNKTRAYEEIVRLHAMQAMRGKKMLAGPIGIRVTAYFPIPKNFTKTKREQAISGALRHTKKPDWDNVGKIVSDALNGVVYADDAMISAAAVIKRYSDFPRLEVWVAEIAQISVDLSWRLC